MARHQQGPMRRFERMSRLKDYTVDKGLADPRGWKVVDSAGHVAGHVTDLIVDTDRMTAAYLEVELDRKTFAVHDDPRILVPMARADRDGSERRLLIPDLTRSRVHALFEARAQHDAHFWERWWRDDLAGREGTGIHESAASSADRRDRDLGRAMSEMRPDEETRIPVGTEPLVQERRRVESAESMRARESDDDRPRPLMEHEHRYRPPLGRPDDARELDHPRYGSRAEE